MVDELKRYQSITLDINKEVITNVTTHQLDKGSRFLIIKCVDNNTPIKLDANTTEVNIKMLTPDDRAIYNICAIQEDGTVLVEFTESMLHSAGKGIAELNIVDKAYTQLLSTMKFIVNIKASVYDDDRIISTDEFTVFLNAIADARKLEDEISDNEDLRIAAEESRVQAEQDRVRAEDIRKESEIDRNTAETNRVTAETKRENDFSTSKTAADIAADNANRAASEADEAVENANTALNTMNDAVSRIETDIDSIKTLINSDTTLKKDDMGVASGVATLDTSGKVPASQLPSFVDDVLEGEAQGVVVDSTTGSRTATGFILTGQTEVCTPETGKIYLDVSSNASYRWGGSLYVTIGSSVSLGTTSTTAFPGNRGLANEKAITSLQNDIASLKAEDISFDNTTSFITSANVQGAIERLTQVATITDDGLLSSVDKARIDNYADVQEIEITLLANSWTGTVAPYTQTVSISSLIKYNNCQVSMKHNASTAEVNQIVNADIADITYEESKGLIFTANGIKPTIDIGILLSVGTSMNMVEIPEYITEVQNVAENISYDNTTSGLVSDNVQDVMDEMYENVTAYGECTTARSTADKVAACSGFRLKKGARVAIRFTDTGTSNPSSGNLTLNVNNTGAKTIVDGHSNKTVVTYSNAGYFYNNMVAEFIYDGAYWVYMNRDANSTYNGSSLKTSAAKTGSGTAVTNTIASGTTMDNAIGTLLNNDYSLNNDLVNAQNDIQSLNSNLNQVSNSLVWKFHKQVSGTEVINLPTVPYNELKFITIVEFHNIQYVFPTHISRIEIENNGDYHRFYLNGEYSANLYTDYRLAVTSKIAILNTLFVNGETFTNNCVTFCYYR